MGLMDKVKSQATQLADKGKQVGQQVSQTGKAKLDEIQAKRKADGLLLELGGLVYTDKVGRPAAGSEVRAAEVVAQLQALEAEHGPVKVTSASESA